MNHTGSAIFDVLSNVSHESMMESSKFMVEPLSTWSAYQFVFFIAVFVIPAEILAKVIDVIIYFLGRGKDSLPLRPTGVYPPLAFTDNFYIYFNRIIMLPIVSWLNVRCIWNSKAVVWDGDLTFFNTFVGFIIVFSLSDLVYYTGHRVVHSIPWLYNFVHKHHHQESHPRNGWADTCNAHPTDFFYTGFSTSPVSVLWVMPANSIHIKTLGILLYCVMFVGAMGHSRLDMDFKFFNTRFHAGHHAMFKYNYAQNIELWDRIFGTYKELEVPAKKKQ